MQPARGYISVIATVLVLCVASRVGAQPTAMAATAQAVSDSVRTDAHWKLDRCLGGITFGAPQKLALAFGGGLVREGMSEHSSDYCAFGAAKLGLGGARGSIGFAQSKGPNGSGLALSADVLRTFGAPLGATRMRTYVGTSLHVWPVFGLGGDIGYFVRLGDANGASPRQRHIVTWSVGFGF